MSSGKAAVAPSILDLINSTCELPTLPDVLVKLQEVVDDPDSSAEEVAEVIALDPAIATNILRIVNSAYYGLQVRVSSVHLAVSIMGFNMTKKVALKAAVFAAFGERDDSNVARFDASVFWRHSLYTAFLTRTIGVRSPVFASVHPEDLYICGLLHDIGTIILCDSAPEIVDKILEESARTGVSVTQLEQERLGYNHGDVGSVLAIKWFLPEDLTIAIRYHEMPSADPFHKALSSLVCLADRCAAQAGFPAFEGLGSDEIPAELMETLQIPETELEALLEQGAKEFEESGSAW